jgi:hypothetical protein
LKGITLKRIRCTVPGILLGLVVEHIASHDLN